MLSLRLIYIKHIGMTSFLLRLSTVIYHNMWLCDCDIFVTMTCDVMLILNINSQNEKWKKIKKNS